MEEQKIENKSETKHSFPLIAGAIFATIPPVAHLMGYSFYQGYLSSFGVDSDIFPISTQYIYINAYYAVTFILIMLLDFLINLLLHMPWYSYAIIAATVLMIYFLSKHSNEENRKTIKNINIFSGFMQKELSVSIGIVWGVLSLFSFLLYCLLAITIIWWLPSYISYREGRKIAIERIELFKQYGCRLDNNINLNKCTVIYDGSYKELYEGFLIAINEKSIALFKKDGTHIFTRKDNFILQRKTN